MYKNYDAGYKQSMNYTYVYACLLTCDEVVNEQGYDIMPCCINVERKCYTNQATIITFSFGLLLQSIVSALVLHTRWQ